LTGFCAGGGAGDFQPMASKLAGERSETVNPRAIIDNTVFIFIVRYSFLVVCALEDLPRDN